jgi:thioredoxin-dependent peroxiredoxin
LRKFDVAYFAASTDTVKTNTRFAESLGLDFPILSDPTKATGRAYGVVGATGFASRWTFYIGADGRILEIDRNVSARRHGEDIVATLKRLGIAHGIA